MDKREQEFDDSVRRKLSEKFIDFDESAWNTMAQRLDPGRGPVRQAPRWWLGAVAAALVTGLCVWAIAIYDREGENPANENAELAITQKETRPARTPGEIPQTARADSLGNNVPVQPLVTEPGPQSETQESFRGGRAVSVQAYPVRSQLALQPSETITLAIPAPRPDQSGFLKRVGPLDRPRTIHDGDLAEANRENGRIRLSLGILAAPDLNGSGGFAGSKAGYNLGLSAGVHFTERLSVHSGILYAKKPYDALPGDYKSGYTPPTLVNIAAVCDVIDIPLNIRYALYRGDQDRVSLSAGVSTYLMLNERYTYEYADRQDAFREYQNENRHFMGVGNLAVVLERKLNDKTSVALEPYLKLPLTGIGQGRVRLLSAGAAVRLNLDLSKK